MSSDDAYMSFLDKANQDTGDASTQSKSKAKFTTASTVDTKEVHPALKKVDMDYASDTDEKFEVVSLEWDGKASIKSTLPFSSSSSVDTLKPKDWDPRGQYSAVTSAVEEAAAGGAEVQVFRVEIDHTRVEYWIVKGDKEGERIVGFKVKAVES